MIKIAAIKPLRIGSSSSSSSSSSSCSPKSKASQNLLQPRKFLELDKVEIATVATNRAQRGSLATQVQNQNAQTTQQNQQKAKKKSSQDQQEVKQQLRPQENKTKFEQSFSFMNTKQKQQSFRRGSSSFLSNKRGSMASMLFDQISQISQKRSSINQTYPNFFATGPTPKESKNNSNMRFGTNIGVPYEDFLENFQNNGFLDPTNTPIGNFQGRKSLTGNNNLASNTNLSNKTNDSNFNTAAAAAVANNNQSLSNNTPICSSNRLPMRVNSSKQINKISDSTAVVKPNDFMATFGGQALDDYTNAQQRAAVTESQLRAQSRNYSNRTAPSCQQENQSMSSKYYSQNLTHSKNSEIVNIPKNKDIIQNNDFGGMFGPITQVPQVQNIPNMPQQISDLNMSNLNLLNSSTLNPSLSIFPNSNENRTLNNPIPTGNNRSVFNRNSLFMNESIFSVPADNKSSRIASIFQNPSQAMRMNKIVDQIKSQSNRSRPASYAGESLKFVRNKNQQGPLGQRDNALDVRSISELSAPFQPYSAPTQLFQFDKQSQQSLVGLLSANQSLGGAAGEGGGGVFQSSSQKSASNNEDLIHH